MCEINDVQHTVNQCQSECDQRVDGAGHQAVEDRRDKNDQRQHDVLGARVCALYRTPLATQPGGIGNIGFAEANAVGRITWMSLPCTCVLTGAAPWFWPSTNLVGP